MKRSMRAVILSMVVLLLLFNVVIGIQNVTNFNRIKLMKTSTSGDLIFGNGEYIQNVVDGVLDEGSANLTTDGSVTAKLINFAGIATSNAGTDSFDVTLDPAITALAHGTLVIFEPDTVNTGAATLNVNSLGAKPIKKLNDQDLGNGHLEAGELTICVYDTNGTDVWHVINPANN